MDENNLGNLEPTTSETNNGNKDKKKIVIIAVILLIIVGLGLYIMYDKRIIFNNTNNDTASETNKNNKSDSKSDIYNNTDEDEDITNTDDNYDEYNDKNASLDLSLNAVCNDSFSINNNTKTCEINGYKFIVKNEISGSLPSATGTIKIYNDKDVLITSYKYTNDYNHDERYAFNSDGSVTVIKECKDKTYNLYCDYEQYSYNGTLLEKNSNYKQIIKPISNYLITVDNLNIALQDFKTNYISGFDFDAKEMTYGGIFYCAGWLNLNGEEIIYVGSEYKSPKSGEYKEIYYIYNPKTKKVSIEERDTHDLYGCSLVVDN